MDFRIEIDGNVIEGKHPERESVGGIIISVGGLLRRGLSGTLAANVVRQIVLAANAIDPSTPERYLNVTLASERAESPCPAEQAQPTPTAPAGGWNPENPCPNPQCELCHPELAKEHCDVA